MEAFVRFSCKAEKLDNLFLPNRPFLSCNYFNDLNELDLFKIRNHVSCSEMTDFALGQ